MPDRRASPAVSGEGLALRQRLAGHILGRQQRRAIEQVQRPRDAHRGVVPQQAALMLRRIVVGGLVEEVGRIAGDQETVGEAGRDPQLADAAAIEAGQLDR